MVGSSFMANEDEKHYATSFPAHHRGISLGLSAEVFREPDLPQSEAAAKALSFHKRGDRSGQLGGSSSRTTATSSLRTPITAGVLPVS